ncbi:MAG: dockerin type I repeat-containing protein [Chloroflexi bacterium]|nr:dockerin type I repeat-containing protein [Chloroflexota bacterium]
MSNRLVLAAVLAGTVVLVAISFWALAERTEATGGNSLANPDTGIVQLTTIALDPSNNPVVAYQHGEPKDEFSVSWTVNVLHCGDQACISGNSLVAPVPDADGFSLRPGSLAVDSSGNPILAHADNTGIITGELKLLYCGNPDCALGNTIVSPDPGSDVTGISLTLDASGRPVISYLDWVGLFHQSVKLLRCGNASCMANNVISTVAEITWGIGAAMTLDGSDYPVIAYLTPSQAAAGDPTGLPPTGGSPAMDLRILRCGNEFCSSGNTFTTVATEINADSPALVLDSSDRPVVVYTQSADDGAELKLVRCGNPDCSSDITVASLATDSQLDVGALRLDASDRPVVVFPQINCVDSPCGSDGTSELQVLHCSDPTCTSGNVTTTVDTAPDFERFRPALVLDSADRPVISYFVRGEGGGLFVLRCGNADCSAGTPKTTPPPTSTDAPTAPPPTNTPVDTPTPTAMPPATSTPLPTTSSSVSGDVSCDGTVDPVDAALILQFAAGLIDTLPCGGLADVNEDGRTDPIDASLILQFAAGLIAELPP